MNSVTLPQVTYKGQPVLTTRALAELLGCKPHAVTVNFGRNQHKFMQGIDFIKINAVEARAAGLPHTTAKLVSQIETLELFRYSSQGVVLFTRRGLAKLSKSVGTPQAWAMMDTFIDAYFTLEGLATGSLTVQEGAAKTQEVVKRGQGLFAGIALQDTPSLPDGDHLRTAMALPVNRMAICGCTFDYILVLLLTLHFFCFGWALPTLALQVSPLCHAAIPSVKP
ncbi:ORF6N domain-containing protein [Craterilacuibacter sinensis]|uniref:ORF6N domain-containing protein n=1 Tax=Craterilacuibacter sinensis TaxID=2686017 RepID=UPI00136F81BC|nr:ORF6N domain-containing protein [Craterilacuibacter sinensis]